jgi:hypothetical protein
MAVPVVEQQSTMFQILLVRIFALKLAVDQRSTLQGIQCERTQE